MGTLIEKVFEGGRAAMEAGMPVESLVCITSMDDGQIILRRLLMSLLSWLGQFLIGWIFTHMSFIIPAKRLRETDTLLAFHHPKPSPFHVIILPEKGYPFFCGPQAG